MHRSEYSQELTETAIDLHRKERCLTLESIRLIDELRRIEPWHFLHMSMEKYAYFIGLTPSKFHKRMQVARTLRNFPKVLELFEKGETTISHIATIANRLTPANEDLLIEAIRNKSKREVEEFIVRVTPSGEILAKQETFEMTVRLNLEQRDMLDRAREVLSHGGHVPSNSELFEAAFKVLLKHKDPLQKAERAAARAAKRVEEKSDGKGHEDQDIANEEAGEGDDEENEPQVRKWGEYERTPVPMAIRHAVFLRDKGQCTFMNGGHERCAERTMLELDHIKMVCRGGGNEVSNLRLRCRYHNQSEARRSLYWNEKGEREWYPRAVS